MILNKGQKGDLTETELSMESKKDVIFVAEFVDPSGPLVLTHFA